MAVLMDDMMTLVEYLIVHLGCTLDEALNMPMTVAAIVPRES